MGRETGSPRVSRRRFVKSVACPASVGSVSAPGIRSLMNPPTRWRFEASEDSFAVPLAEGHEIVYVSTRNQLSAISKATGSEQWYLEANSPFVSPGTITDVAAYVDTREDILAVNPRDGNERWRFEGGDTAKVASDTVYVVNTNDGKVAALDATTGDERWQYTADEDLVPSVTLGENDVYVGTWQGNLRALSRASGSLRWQSDLSTGEPVGRSTRVHPLDVILKGPGRSEMLFVQAAVEDESTLIALSSDGGTELWRSAGSRIATPVLGTVSDEFIVLSDVHRVQVISPSDGTLHWQHTEDQELMPATRVSDEIVITATTTGTIQARSRTDGAKLWEATTGSDPEIAPLAGGTVVVASGRKVYAISRMDGTRRWVFEAANQIVRSPRLLSDDTICFGTTRGTVYRIDAMAGTLTGKIRNNIGAVIAGGLIGGGLLGGIYVRLQRTNSGEANDAVSIDDFELLEQVERGECVERYRARDRSTDDNSELVTLERYRESSRKAEAFERKVEKLAGIEHENVASVRCWGTSPNPWVVIECAMEGSFDAYVDDLNLETCVEILSRASEAIHFAHKNGLAHTRLNPEWILIPDGTIGRVQVDGWTRSVFCPVKESHPYSAPEQRDGTATSDPIATDIYQLGAITYQLLTGRTMGESGTPEHEFVPPSRLNTQLSSNIDDVLATALQCTPRQRHDTALEFRDALRWAMFIDEK